MSGISRTVVLINEKGLHARASHKFTECVNSYDARVTVTKGDETVTAHSIMELLMLGAGVGTELTLTAEGVEAEAVLNALAELVANRFGEKA